MAALALVPPRQTLYEVESDLLTLLECVEQVQPEHEDEYLEALQSALSAAAEKRDAVAHYMSHLETQVELSKAEKKRIQARQSGFETALERLKDYVVRIMEQAGAKKLEGATTTFSRRKCPAAVEIYDQNQIPLEYQSVSVSLPAKMLDEILDVVPFEMSDLLRAIVRPEDYAIDKRALKAALETRDDVPGAKIAPEKWALVRL
jgi:hypothetical protein